MLSKIFPTTSSIYPCGYSADKRHSIFLAPYRALIPRIEPCSMYPGYLFWHTQGIAARSILPFLCFIFTLCGAGSVSGADLFPYYPAIKTNVAFWEKVYSTYSINSAIIHDRNDLSKVYEVVQLMDRELPAASRINSAMVTIATEKYQKILENLASGKVPSTTTEQRVAQMFKGNGSRQRMALAAESIRSQIGQKERFYEGVVRSGRYISGIRAIFKAHGLPTELAYLPHVESSFNTEAYSKAGASGIWQFTLGTGKQYMQIDDAVDERSDPFIAAEAAARYLRNGYEKLGSWPLALTAYNYGTAGMVRARDAKGDYERIFLEYREGNFGFASQNFYAEFLAAIQVAKKLESSQQVRLERPIQFFEYTLPGHIHINEVRRHFRVSDLTIKKYNPALLPAVYNGKKLLPAGYRLRLPADKNVRNLAANIPRSYFRSSQIRDKYHQVRPGETLIRIAARHGVSVKVLAAANGLPHNAKVRIGQKLRIPPLTTSITSSLPSPALAATKGKQVKKSPPGSTKGPPSGTPLVLSAETSKIERITAN